MAESSPGGPSPEKDMEVEDDRPMAVGALRRVFKKRHERAGSRVGRRRARVDDDESSEGESGEDDGYVHVQKTTNHYTLNMPGPAAPQSDLPYRLLGCVFCYMVLACAEFNGRMALAATCSLVSTRRWQSLPYTSSFNSCLCCNATLNTASASTPWTSCRRLRNAPWPTESTSAPKAKYLRWERSVLRGRHV